MLQLSEIQSATGVGKRATARIAQGLVEGGAVGGGGRYEQGASSAELVALVARAIPAKGRRTELVRRTKM